MKCVDCGNPTPHDWRRCDGCYERYLDTPLKVEAVFGRRPRDTLFYLKETDEDRREGLARARCPEQK